MTAGLSKCADGTQLRPSVCGVANITILDTPTMPLNLAMRPVGLSRLQISFALPADTGAGTSAFPLLRYDFEYYQVGAEAATTKQVQLGHTTVTHITEGLTLGESYQGRLRAVNDADLSPWTEYVQARALLQPDAPGQVQAANAGSSY